MKVLKGKYNYAKVMADIIDETTEKQIVSMLDHPAFKNSKIVIQADCHAGAGAVIGFTSTLNDYIIPNIVGVDIGCGMLMGLFRAEDIDLHGLDNFIKNNIPSGFSVNDVAYDVDNPFYTEIESICSAIGIPSQRVFQSIGTLGGGNHFIEAGWTESGLLAVTIHSGSRNFGLKIANYYQDKAKAMCDAYFFENKGLEFLLTDSADGKAYLSATKIAQQYASLNRINMLNRISSFLKAPIIDTIETVHNYIGADNIIRKGAVSARAGEKVILPFNMADGLAICVGKGNPEYNYSAPHGAGRIMGRMEAKRSLDMGAFTERMSGVYTTTATEATLDEAPMAYKPMESIISCIGNTLEIKEFVKPIYNFKAIC